MTDESESLCVRCKSRGWCGRSCKILARLKQFQPKVSEEFSGSSPPEVFVGKFGYPRVFTGILAPAEFGETEKLSMPELWHDEQATIQDILTYRSRLIYSRFLTTIRHPQSRYGNATQTSGQESKLFETMQEIALASKSVDASFKLRKRPRIRLQVDSHTPIIGNPAPLKAAKLESNPRIEKKVDYLTNDTDVKATRAIEELYSSRIPVSHIIKILSVGMLGLRVQRRVVPTRWAVTATDDALGKKLLERIRYYQELSVYQLFSANYLGNHYNILLMPGCWSFEVIEASAKGYFGLGSKEVAMWHDYEFFQARKKYASSVTGAYYANRLAVCEYLERVKRQASCLVLREIREEYWAPCGVGILREVTREAMSKRPREFATVEEAIKAAQLNFKLPIGLYTSRSKLLGNLKTQTKLSRFL